MSQFSLFYTSRAWQRTRAAYAASRGHLCERCLARGLIVPGDQVHHRRKLTTKNINDPAVTLSFDNLELLCASCHEEEHRHRERRRKRRYEIDADGRVHLQEETNILHE